MREALVQSKCYFADGSASFVFYYGVADVVALVKQAVDAVSSAAVNRLFSKFAGQERAGLVVQYATSAMAIYGGSSVIKHLADVIKEDFTLATDGWMLEIFIFASLRKGGVTLLAEDGSEIQWAWAKIKVTSPSNLLLLLDTEGTWIKPPVFNQGGYDAVYLEKTQGLVHFVQVRTRAHSRSAFHIGYFYKSLKDLQQPSQSFEVTTREIFFVVDMKTFEQGFKNSEVSGQGLLAAFPEWAMKGREMERVKVVKFQGPYT